jgi:hypothetical protein
MARFSTSRLGNITLCLAAEQWICYNGNKEAPLVACLAKELNFLKFTLFSVLKNKVLTAMQPDFRLWGHATVCMVLCMTVLVVSERDWEPGSLVGEGKIPFPAIPNP